jgi:hypothetical protein
MPPRNAETQSGPEAFNDRAALVLAQVTEQHKSGADQQDLDPETAKKLAAELDHLYESYRGQATGPGGAERQLDRHVATRNQYFDLVDQYIFTRAVHGLAAEGIGLPGGMDAPQAEQAANLAREQLGGLYTPSQPEREASISSIGRAAGVHETLHDAAHLPADVAQFLNEHLAEELKIAAVSGNYSYIEGMRNLLAKLHQEPFLRDNQLSEHC